MMADFIRQLRLLPYNDMMVVARELNAMLPNCDSNDITDANVADVLGKLSEMKLADSPDTTQEAKLMREIFSRRRSITVKCDGKGYQIQIETLGASVLHTDIKVGLQQLLDTVVTAHALRK